MHKIKWVFSLLLMILLISGCNNSEEQKIVVEKLDDNGQYHRSEITDRNQVLNLKDLIKEYSWKKGEIESKDKADYIFYFEYTNPSAQAKVITYYVSLIEDGTAQVSKEDTEYISLNKDDTKELLELLTKN